MIRRVMAIVPVPGLRAACAVALVAVAGCDGVPRGLEAEDRDHFEQAAASIGCELVGEGDYLTVEFQTGLSRAQVLELVKAALQAGRAEKREGGGVRLIDGACAADRRSAV